MKISICSETMGEHKTFNTVRHTPRHKQKNSTNSGLFETHVFDEKGMQHDISETIILQGGKQGWLLEHKHRHNLCSYKPKREKQEQGARKKKKKEIIIPNNGHKFHLTSIKQTVKCQHIQVSVPVDTQLTKI